MLGSVTDYLELLEFWFGELTDGIAGESRRKNWFAASAEFDQQCTVKFGHLLTDIDALSGGQDWGETPRAQIAYVILYDQMPRNIFRGHREAFAYDHLALEVAKRGIEQGVDQHLKLDERAFFYRPFEHSESLLDQHIAVGLFTALRDSSPKHLRSRTGNSLRSAQQHRDIIVRFGRFPHRNHLLGRKSSDAEAIFIEDGNGFGQT